MAIGWVCILFFGLCAIVGARRMVRADVEIRVDTNGIYWRRRSHQTIPWAAIDRIATSSVRGQHFACLFLRDPGAFPATGLVGRMAAINKAMGFGDIALSATGTDRSFAAMMDAISAFAPPRLRP